MQFIPDETIKTEFEFVVPYLEEATAQNSRGHATKKTQDELKREIVDLLNELGARKVTFMQGAFPTSPKRYGYRITFRLSGIPGRMDVAGLPIRNETPTRKDQALKQALYLFAEMLRAELDARIYRPGYVALVPHLIGEGEQTVIESLLASGMLPDMSAYAPMLPAGAMSNP